ncbi:SMI1/KNR4 family protein [Flavobacterium sharifuzzamanii]|uniref:SMI1/KNR4 family protein n=1 Tax=Flavobacterium sharifuzzamanii TaxID=2211133 RepID=UPI000DAC2655|nr:SMI1/KNR4 family protein [Flavobacterium sharifuzzamanii]KAF2081961.1 SMI1/KNR4 family protein [Flavobacterium sharifuzzamanii]
MENGEIIKKIIDLNLNNLIEFNGNILPQKIELEMADPNQDNSEEWKTWFPVASTVTDDEIEELQNQIGCEFPEDYKMFLKYKHFYELHISEASFFEHPINSWKMSLVEKIFHEHLKDDLIDNGLIPFAMWEDWGYLCFDTNRNNGDNNYPVVLWDHEFPDQVNDKYEDFYDFIKRSSIEE